MFRRDKILTGFDNSVIVKKCRGKKNEEVVNFADFWKIRANIESEY
jgi:hypothetical protein